MSPKHTNTQMFALRSPPADTIELAGGRYRLRRVFKHDFFAATCLYVSEGTACKAVPPEFPSIVVKFGREQSFFSLPLRWLGRWMHEHERAIYRALAGVRGVPRWAGSLSETAYAIEYIDALPLDHLHSPPAGFFDRLAEVFRAIHARGVGYCDANKRSNILVGADGEPFLVDYQLAIRLRDDLPQPIRAIVRAAVRYVAERDIYHLCKHKRRLAPQELTPEEETISRRRSGLHLLHRKLTKPWRAVRRRFLRRQYERGRLVSPTAQLEDHHQPEKQTWRTGGESDDS